MMGCVIAVQIAADTDWNTFLQKEKRTLRECSFSFGRGIRIRTLNNGVRVTKLLSKTYHFKPYFLFSISQKSLKPFFLNKIYKYLLKQ